MNLRLPIVVGVVAVAAGAAAFRNGKPAISPAAFASDGPAANRSNGGRRHGSSPSPSGIVVYVAGDVRHAGVFELSAGSRAIDALSAAGGPGPGADLVAVNLAQQLSDGDEVAVPAIGDVSEPAGTVSSDTAPRKASHAAKHRKRGAKRKHRRRSSGSSASGFDTGLASDAASADSSDAGPSSVVDINTADETELQTLPGIGATLAERIVAFREQTGPFASADDLLDVAGVSQAKLDAIAPYLTVGSATP